MTLRHCRHRILLLTCRQALLFVSSLRTRSDMRAALAGPFAALARRLALPQTATLSLGGPLTVPETDGGRAWHQAFAADGSMLPVRLQRLAPSD